MSELSDYEPTDGYAVHPLPGESMVVLRPGDRVLVHFARDVDLEHAKSCIDHLRERFPGVEFSALSGAVERVVIDRAEEE